MKKVEIAELKTHLSTHLRSVRHEQEILVLDREEPIAKVIPFQKGDSGLAILKKSRTKGKLKRLKFKPLKIEVDATQLLRGKRRFLHT